MKFQLTILTHFFLIFFSTQKFIKEQDGVLLLTPDNFDQAIKQYDNLLVQFTSTWCNKCDRISAEYAKAAQLLSKIERPVYLAKIDGFLNQDIKERFVLKSYPAFIYFQGGVEMPYRGGSESYLDFYNWLYKKTQGAVKLISKEEQLQQDIDIHDTFVLYFGKTDIFEYIKIYEIIARRYDQAFFARASDNSELYEIFNVTHTPHVVMFRHFESNGLHYNKNWTARNLERWIVQYSAPTVFHYNDKFAHHVFIHKHVTVFLFRESKNETHSLLDDKFIEIVNDLKNEPDHEEVLFAICDYNNSAHKKVADMMGLTRFDYPKLAIIHPHADKIEKYIFKEEDLHEHMTYNKLLEFLGHFKEGKLARHLKSEDHQNSIVFNEQENIYVLKSNSGLMDFVNQKDKEKIVLFHADFCHHCQKFMPTFKYFAKQVDYLKEKGLEVGILEASKSDLDIRITQYPTIYFFDKMGNKVQYNSQRNFLALQEFLIQNSAIARKYYKIQTNSEESDSQKTDL